MGPSKWLIAKGKNKNLRNIPLIEVQHTCLSLNLRIKASKSVDITPLSLYLKEVSTASNGTLITLKIIQNFKN
jgi:hypothetical protein